MRRYQLYLDPHSVNILDDFEKHSNISRSKLIRAVVDRFANEITKVFITPKTIENQKYFLDDLIGIIDLKNKKETNYASKPDKIYLED